MTRIDRELAKLGAADTPLGAQLRARVTLPGLGLTTAAARLASLPWNRLETARQVAAYVGRCLHERTAGSSRRGRGHSGPLGPAALRTALYLPVSVAMRCNPALRVFAERLRANGQRPKMVITAALRKLLLLAWTLLRTGQPFLTHSPRATYRCLTAKTYPDSSITSTNVSPENSRGLAAQQPLFPSLRPKEEG